MSRRHWIASSVLVAGIAVTAVALAAWKQSSLQDAETQAASQPEPMESIDVAVARERLHRRTTTSIGTVVATRSITVRNELPGTVRHVTLTPGTIVEPGTVLVGLDVAVEQADLRALRAQAALAEIQFARMQRMLGQRAASEMEVDTARADRDVALAQIARVEAIIERKTIRAPFRARVGISDVHPGQYLNEGTLLTTLQGIDDKTYIDFTTAQQVAATLQPGQQIEVVSQRDSKPYEATIVATDARVDPGTRNATVRAQIAKAGQTLTPGASVRVRVPTETERLAIAIPASALRKGPEGDFVFVVETDEHGKTRARMRHVQVETLAGDEVIVLEGLRAGDQIAASGSFKLRDAVLVAINNKAPSAVAQNTQPQTGLRL